MHDMHFRKLVKAGQTSHTISLPKEWLKKNNLRKGSHLYIHETSDHELIVTPQQTNQKQTPKKEITIVIDKKDPGTIQRELTSAYINNYSSIIFSGKDLDKHTKTLRTIIQSFVALEVAEQTTSKLIVKDFLNLGEISIDQTLRRMDMIIRSMLKDSIKALEGKQILESINYRDEDINKLYFLMYRLLKNALTDQQIAKQFELTNPEILSRWYLILNLEAIADCGKQLCKILLELEKDHNKEKIQQIYKKLQSAYEQSMKAFFAKSKEEAHNVAKQRISIFDDCNNYFKSIQTIQGAALTEQCKEMETLICNIARIVIDHE